MPRTSSFIASSASPCPELEGLEAAHPPAHQLGRNGRIPSYGADSRRSSIRTNVTRDDAVDGHVHSLKGDREVPATHRTVKRLCPARFGGGANQNRRSVATAPPRSDEGHLARLGRSVTVAPRPCRRRPRRAVQPWASPIRRLRTRRGISIPSPDRPTSCQRPLYWRPDVTPFAVPPSARVGRLE